MSAKFTKLVLSLPELGPAQPQLVLSDIVAFFQLPLLTLAKLIN